MRKMSYFNTDPNLPDGRSGRGSRLMGSSAAVTATALVEVERGANGRGRSLKVLQAGEMPHLVSLGGDRFSTAVTLHQLPDSGRVSIGCSGIADIPVYGTGVEECHCWIENTDGLVVLIPNSGNILIDGLKVTNPTRLAQGCMICIGRSNFFRFNHPKEAKFMKSVLPNTRISMMPNIFYPNNLDESSGSQRSYESTDSWYDSCVSPSSSEDLLSPKVFPADSCTFNSPASVVLGHKYFGAQKNNRNGAVSPAESTISVNSARQRIAPPSPAFDRDPKYCTIDKYGQRSPTNTSCLSSPPIISSSPLSKYNGNSSDSFESPTFNADKRKQDPDLRRKQIHHQHLVEQERLERLRLEDILSMCTEYEQHEKSGKPQNRIITNGSLPREKKNSLSISPRAKTPDYCRNGSAFKFDQNTVKTFRDCDYSNNSMPNSPRSFIRTNVSSKENCSFDGNSKNIKWKETPATNGASENYNLLNGSSNNSPTELRMRRTKNENSSFDPLKEKNGGNSNLTIQAKNTKHKYQFLGVDLDDNDGSISTNENEIISGGFRESYLNAPNSTNNTDTASVSMIEMENYRRDSLNENYATLKPSKKTGANVSSNHNNTLPLMRNGKRVENKYVKFSLPYENNFNAKRMEDSKYIMPLDEINCALRKQCFLLKRRELKKLEVEQNLLLEAIGNVNNRLIDIQTQKDDIVRELELEKALLEGELKCENTKLKEVESRLVSINIQVANCEASIVHCSNQQSERQQRNVQFLKEHNEKVERLEKEKSSTSDEDEKLDLKSQIKKEYDLLEMEVKSYEDFEFQLLEEEASLLSKREELQNELSDATSQLEQIRAKLNELYTQKEQLLKNASDDIRNLEIPLRNYTITLQKNRSRIQEINARMKEISIAVSEFAESEKEKFHSENESARNHSKTQSQEDLDRISRVTNAAPIVKLNGTNSLGRRVLASLQEIERNRQIHLAEQGSHVIEEERKRVSALKRRVQDEVKAEWEERRQREVDEMMATSMTSNCFSDTSSLTSSEFIIDDNYAESTIRSSNCTTTPDENSSNTNSNDNSENKSEFSRTESNTESNENAMKTDSQSIPSLCLSEPDKMAVKMRMNSLDIRSKNVPECRNSLQRRESFDLRIHIQTAGHQLENCPHVTLDKNSCRGYLQKMTSRFRTWNKRWFLFDRDKCSFVYFSDKNQRKVKGGTYFQGLADLCIDKSNVIKSPNPQATFIVKTTERVYYLLAPNVEAMRIWFDVLATEIESFQET